MSHRDTWAELIRLFLPESADARADWRAERPESPVIAIEERLNTPHITPRVLLIGTIGAGKTTELQHLVATRATQDFVVMLDLARVLSSEGVGHAEALQRVNAWEVCFLAAVAVYRAATEQFGLSFSPHRIRELKQAWSNIQPPTADGKQAEIDVLKLAQGLALTTSAAVALASPAAPLGAKLAPTALAHLAAAGKMVVSWGRRNATLDEPGPMETMQTLLDAVNALIGDVQAAHRRVLLVLDGLDRIRTIERARALFVESDLLGRLACPVVACGPFALRHHPALISVPHFDPKILVNVPVLDQDDPTREGPGIDFLVEVYQRRVADLPTPLVNTAQLRRLAYYSGGTVREFVRLVGRLAERGYHDNLPHATDAQIETVLDERRRQIESGLTSDHGKVLRAVMADPKHELPNNNLCWDMLTTGQLLPYPDGSEWFYPHPLLTLGFLRD